jgi:hypothetical protein
MPNSHHISAIPLLTVVSLVASLVVSGCRGYVFLFDDLLVLTKPEKGGADAPRTYVLVKAYSLSGYTASSHFELASCEGACAVCACAVCACACAVCACAMVLTAD